MSFDMIITNNNIQSNHRAHPYLWRFHSLRALTNCAHLSANRFLKQTKQLIISHFSVNHVCFYLFIVPYITVITFQLTLSFHRQIRCSTILNITDLKSYRLLFELPFNKIYVGKKFTKCSFHHILFIIYLILPIGVYFFTLNITTKFANLNVIK